MKTGIFQSEKQIQSAQTAKIKQLETENQQLKEALETMCKFHETNASWDKGNNGYYLAKRLLNPGK